jgi:hypothetical protein
MQLLAFIHIHSSSFPPSFFLKIHLEAFFDESGWGGRRWFVRGRGSLLGVSLCVNLAWGLEVEAGLFLSLLVGC